jgi:hypothetical protein
MHSVRGLRGRFALALIAVGYLTTANINSTYLPALAVTVPGEGS